MARLICSSYWESKTRGENQISAQGTNLQLPYVHRTLRGRAKDQQHWNTQFRES
jgi:hypothetical protein